MTTQLAPDAPSPGRNKTQGKTEHYMCHSHDSPDTETSLHPGIAELLGRSQRVTFCTVRQRRANPCLSENPTSRVTPPSQLVVRVHCVLAPHLTHPLLVVLPIFVIIELFVWPLGRLLVHTFRHCFSKARPFEQSRCLRHAATSDSSQSHFIPRQATETALYGRLSLLRELLSPHFMISMVSDGSVSECHESVPSTPSCLAGGASAAKA